MKNLIGGQAQQSEPSVEHFGPWLLGANLLPGNAERHRQAQVTYRRIEVVSIDVRHRTPERGMRPRNPGCQRVGRGAASN